MSLEGGSQRLSPGSEFHVNPPLTCHGSDLKIRDLNFEQALKAQHALAVAQVHGVFSVFQPLLLSWRSPRSSHGTWHTWCRETIRLRAERSQKSLWGGWCAGVGCILSLSWSSLSLAAPQRGSTHPACSFQCSCFSRHCSNGLRLTTPVRWALPVLSAIAYFPLLRVAAKRSLCVWRHLWKFSEDITHKYTLHSHFYGVRSGLSQNKMK